MGLTRKELQRLEDDAVRFTPKNHPRYIADTAQSLAQAGDPLAALRLLDALWGSAFAKSLEEKAALDDVGLWLVQRLGREPEVRVERLALELGWLRWMAFFARPAGRNGGPEPQPREPRPARTSAFHDLVQALEERRSRPPPTPRSPPARLAPVKPPELPPPTELPAVFDARFVNFDDARKAAATVRERKKKDKPAKDRLLPLVPRDARLGALASGLSCSVLRTEGFDEVFAGPHEREPLLRVTEVERQADGTLLARRITHLSA